MKNIIFLLCSINDWQHNEKNTRLLDYILAKMLMTHACYFRATLL